MKVSIDKSQCLGCGICIDVCPDVFEMDGDGTVVAKPGPVPAEAEEAVRDAAERCPGGIIQIDGS